MLYSTLGRQISAASLVVTLLASLSFFWVLGAASQTASGVLSVGATVINSCNVNRTLATELPRPLDTPRRLQCWQPGSREDNRVKPDVFLLNEGGNQRRVLVVY